MQDAGGFLYSTICFFDKMILNSEQTPLWENSGFINIVFNIYYYKPWIQKSLQVKILCSFILFITKNKSCTWEFLMYYNRDFIQRQVMGKMYIINCWRILCKKKFHLKKYFYVMKMHLFWTVSWKWQDIKISQLYSMVGKVLYLKSQELS